MRIEYPCALEREDTLARLRALGEYLFNRHKISVVWVGERATFNGRFKKLVKIAGEMSVSDGRILFVGEDPGTLWRGKAIKYIRSKLDIYLDPAADLTALPRGL